jgi:coenzyme F420-reducing hydrogenase alpha subunit
MPAANIRIAVSDGEPVIIPVEHLSKAAFIQTLLNGDQTESDTLDVDISRDGRNYSSAAIQAIAAYVKNFASGRPSTIPKPLPGSMDRYINEWERDFIKSLLKDNDVWQHESLVEVLNVAYRLELESLRDLLAGWIAVQIDELVKDKNMLDGAEAIRNFFDMPNEWDAEQMENLRAEMVFYEQDENKN